MYLNMRSQVLKGCKLPFHLRRQKSVLVLLVRNVRVLTDRSLEERSLSWF